MNRDTLAINAIRVLSAEAIDKSKSGHPGLPLGCAPVAYELYAHHMKFNPLNPDFANRDRFVLSAGHGSMLMYSLLHLFGFGLTKEDLMNFRQAGSLTPGHPEYRHTKGVETTTGPLGQGVANAVGMAIAESHLAAIYNREGYPVVDHYTYALCGDGCMMEGIESEAASLAGTLKLGKLIVLYDDNGISIEGDTDTAFTEDVGARHEAQGWQVIYVDDANDVSAVAKAIESAKAETEKPSLIVFKSVIGYGSPLAGNADCHGSPLGADNTKALKEFLGWTCEPFEVPAEVKAIAGEYADLGAKVEKDWNDMMSAYAKAYPDLYDSYLKAMNGELPDLEKIEDLWTFEKDDASRGYSGTVLNKLYNYVPTLMGGSADLAPSNKSNIKKAGYYGADSREGINMHFGVREHAMGAIVNGMQLHGGVRAYCATFFVFVDYMKHAIRLASLMKLPITYILTHDSIGVGEDGPTHEPVEQLVSLRSTPGVKVFRPADGIETTAGYISAMTGDGPTALVLSRQTLPRIEGEGRREGALRGGYVLRDCEGDPDVILMASGSEVGLILKAYEKLTECGVLVRVVSIPCMELFDSQDPEYIESVLPYHIRARVAVEAGSSYSWYKYVGIDGEMVTMDTFGASAPAGVLFEQFGFTVDNVVDKAFSAIANNTYFDEDCIGECSACDLDCPTRE